MTRQSFAPGTPCKTVARIMFQSAPLHRILPCTLFVVLLLLPGIGSAQSDTDETESFSSSSRSEQFDIGGDKFKGGGDKRNPRCQIAHPLSAGSEFYIEWNCEDDGATRGEIVTEIWILRPGAPRYVKVSDYLGFPASLLVDELLLGMSLSEGLPASFILVARDTAGNAAISAPFTITGRDNDVDTCSLSLATRPTTSDGNTTGVPALIATLDQVATFTQSSTNTSFTISMFNPEIASPCEIDGLCSDAETDSELFFTAAVTVGEDGEASARLNLTPGEFAINLEGSGTVASDVLENVSLSGTTVIDSTVTDVSLTCSRS